jgi:biopolymer transport protein ExbD
MKIAAGPVRQRRRLNMTPMIDVVLLLLVFFMMVSRFGTVQGLPLGLATGGAAEAWAGPPRLVDVTPQGPELNGVAVPVSALIAALTPLMATPGDPVILRARDGADVQGLVAVLDALRGAGMTRILLVE